MTAQHATHRHKPSVFLVLAALLVLALPAYGSAAVYEADLVPFSGYWWPKNLGGLATGRDYNGRPAPLEKYSYHTVGYASGPVQGWYLNTVYNQDALSWEGYCYAWACSATYDYGPILPGSRENLRFEIGDKKGLLTLAHTNDLAEKADGTNPATFHYWLLNYLQDQGKCFVADLDSGEEVWSYPIYKMDMKTATVGSTMSVSVDVYYVTDDVHPDYHGAITFYETYTYDLVLGADGSIVSGEYTGASVGNHPNRLTFSLMQRSFCEDLDMNAVNEILAITDDYLEGQSVLDPGFYRLVSLDDDIYTLSGETGDTGRLRLVRSDQNANLTYYELKDASDAVVAQGALTALDDTLELTFAMDAPPYTLNITQENYDAPGVYDLTYDRASAATALIPYINKSSFWTGFALANPNGDTPVQDVSLVAMNESGDPVRTIWGPTDIAAGQKQVFFYDDIEVWTQDKPEVDYLAVLGKGNLAVLELSGSSQGALFGYDKEHGVAEEAAFVIPDLRSSFSGYAMYGGVANKGLAARTATVTAYSADGQARGSETVALAGKERYLFRPGLSPFVSAPDGGWALVTPEPAATEQGGDLGLTAFHNVSSVTLNYADGVQGLAVSTEPGYVPHVPEYGYWSTLLTLINPNASAIRVLLHLTQDGADGSRDRAYDLAPYQKLTLDLTPIYGTGTYGWPFRSMVRVTADGPFAGCFSYVTPNDTASMPLLPASEASTSLTLPHYPGYTPWWTGIVLGNLGSATTTVTATAYDAAGTELPGFAFQTELSPGEYDVFALNERYGTGSGSVSHVRFTSSGGPIGGFYLYGNDANTMLTGNLF